ncbi:nucleotide excision repair endonuclease [candidate division KSB1 bacterium]|nr:nucleotide excision repair endonuclease [candidate division KSB1 bacterium]
MKEKIYHYIKERDQGVSSQEISEVFLHVLGQSPLGLDRIIESMLRDDSRFVRDEIGEWHVNKKDEGESFADIVFSIIELDFIPIDSKNEVPALLGIARVKNEHVISHQFFSLEIPAHYSPQIKNTIDQLQEDVPLYQAFNQSAEAIHQNLQKSVIISYSPSKVMAILGYFFREHIGLDLEAELISLVDLARKLIPGIKIRSIEDIANSLSISFHSPLDLKDRLNLTADILLLFLQELKQSNIHTLTDLRAFIESAKTWVDFSGYNFNQDFIKNLPTTPGVYLMKDGLGKIFYVGKAKNLKSRVESYFVNRFEMDEKGKAILARILDLTYEPVGSELEALLLENRYINEFQPDLNTQIKIHPLDVSKYKTRQLIFFLPSKTEHEIVLFFVNGVFAMERSIMIRLKSNWHALKREMKHFFSDPANKKSSFSADQIEILWRWFVVQQEQINFIDIASCVNLDECLELVKKYCGDERLFLDKIYYR